MQSLELKIPPVVVFFVAALGVYLSPRQPSLYVANDDYTHLIGIAIFILGVCIGLAGVITFKFANTTVNPVSIENASQLVTKGIFRISRNPMYLGMAFGIVGLGIFLQTHWILLLLCLFFFTSYLTRFQIVPEERMLTTLFEQEYTEYLQNTRRWI